jgi:hypothetical protein
MLGASLVARAQDDWQYTPGILVVSGSRLSNLEPKGSLISVHGSRRISRAQLKDGFSIYHVLVFAPESPCGRSSTFNKGPQSIETPIWRCGKSEPEFLPLNITYHALDATVTINSESFNLSRGNLFVVHFDNVWKGSTVQLTRSVNRLAEPEKVLHAFRKALPNDHLVRTLRLP